MTTADARFRADRCPESTHRVRGQGRARSAGRRARATSLGSSMNEGPPHSAGSSQSFEPGGSGAESGSARNFQMLIMAMIWAMRYANCSE